MSGCGVGDYRHGDLHQWQADDWALVCSHFVLAFCFAPSLEKFTLVTLTMVKPKLAVIGRKLQPRPPQKPPPKVKVPKPPAVAPYYYYYDYYNYYD